MLLKTSRDEDSTVFLGNLFHCLTTLLISKVLPHTQYKFHVMTFKIIIFLPAPYSHKK